ncbi:MAG: hypothetical protein ACJASV_001719 [Pseudorhodobacter sp.]|jgi:uncharacterized protein
MIRLLAILIWLPLAAFAQSFPEPLSDTLSDFANLLDAESAARVTTQLQSLRDETGVHLVVVTIEQQSDYGSTERFPDFATKWFNRWGIGDATRNDGILILVARRDREMRIVLGDAYGPVWDGRAQRVIDTAMLPEFRGENYQAGIEAGVASARERLALPFAAKETVTEDSGFPDDAIVPKIIGSLMVAILVISSILAVFSKKLGAGILRLRRCPKCRARGLQREHVVIDPAQETTPGSGVSHLRCNSCGDDRTTRYTIPSLASARKARKRSSSRGFGGGSSSGGGASGKW